MTSFEKCLSVRRWLTFLTGLVECLFFTGAVYGWSSLLFIIKDEGYLSWLCVNITEIQIMDVNITEVNVTQALDCSEQDERFSLIFTIAVCMQTFLTLSSGIVLDKFGTTVARLWGIILFTTGTLMIAFSTPALSILLFPAVTFIAVAGGMLLLSNMQIGNLFHSHRSTVITLYSGAYGFSAVLFLIIKEVHEAGISLYTSFLFISACSVIHLLRTLFLMPRNIIPYPLPEHYTYGITCGESNSASVGLTEVTSNRNNTVNKGQMDMSNDAQSTVSETSTERTYTECQGKNFRECVLSRLFVFHVLWLSVFVFRNLFFIGTLNPMLQRMTGEDHLLVSHYTKVFSMMQLCALLFAPWNGLIIDRQRGKPRSAGESEYEADLRAMVLSLFLATLQSLLFSLCATFPILHLQYVTFILQVLNRSFSSGCQAAFINVAFPLCHFGKLFGLAWALAGLFSLLQYPCFMLIEEVLHGDPLYVNIALVLFTLFSFIHPIYVYLHCRSLASQRASGNNTVSLLSVTYRRLVNALWRRRWAQRGYPLCQFSMPRTVQYTSM